MQKEAVAVLDLVARAVASAKHLAEQGRFEKAEEALEEAVKIALKALKEDVLRDAATVQKAEQEGLL